MSYSASFKTTGSKQVDLLLVTLHAKSFARMDYWESLGHSKESLEETKQELVVKGLLSKNGAIKSDIKTYYYNHRGQESERVQYLQHKVGTV